MFEVGRVCYKIAGRDAGQVCVVVDSLDKKQVLIDGNVRRRKCSVLHLEPINKIAKIKKGAATSEVKKALEELKIKVKETKKVKRSPKKEVKKSKDGSSKK